MTQEWEIFMKFSCSIMVTSSEHGWRLRDKLYNVFVFARFRFVLTASSSPFGWIESTYTREREGHGTGYVWWFRLHARWCRARRNVGMRNDIDGRARVLSFFPCNAKQLRRRRRLCRTAKKKGGRFSHSWSREVKRRLRVYTEITHVKVTARKTD